MCGQRKNDNTKHKEEREHSGKTGESQQEITITVMIIPALMQTRLRLKGETRDRQWVGRQI